MAYINSTRTVVNNVGTDIALAGAGSLFTVSGSLGGTKSLTLSDGFINNGAPEANLIVPLLFPNGHNDLGPSLYLEITVAGVTNPIPVVSNQNGTLAPIPHHEMTEGGSTVYKVVDPNTILNVYYTADYDGSQNPAFVVVGNPLVLSSSTYSIYANGYDEIGYNTLSPMEVVPNLTINNWSEMQYDGFFTISCENNATGYIYLKITRDEIDIKQICFAGENTTNEDIGALTVPIMKGDKLSVFYTSSTPQNMACFANYYKKRDYSNR